MPGNSCFWAAEPNAKQVVKYTITTIIKNGEIVEIKLVYPPDANGKGADPKSPGF